MRLTPEKGETLMSLASQPRITFAGTGTQGKPRVAIGKASYALNTVESLINHPDVEVVGVATDSDGFTRLLQEQKPDVVVIGSIFGGLGETPMGVLENVISSLRRAGDTTTKTPGVVVNSMYTRSSVDALKQFSQWLNHLNPTEKPLQYQHVDSFEEDLDTQLLNAIKAVDPSPVSPQ